jgi:shikimate 5-dehydrogenase
MTDVTVVIGAGGIGQAIARRISSGRRILVANHTQDSADDAARLLMGPEGGFITGSDFLIDGGATANYFHGPNAGMPA